MGIKILSLTSKVWIAEWIDTPKIIGPNATGINVFFLDFCYHLG